MGKMSKSNQDPHQTEKNKEELRLLLSKESKHFTEGTYVFVNGRRGRVVFNYWFEMLVAYDDDETKFYAVIVP